MHEAGSHEPACIYSGALRELAAGIVVSTEAGKKENPNQPFAAVIVVITATAAAAVSGKNTGAVSAAAKA